MAGNFPWNTAQIKGLANFFFDIAKGFILGGMGLTTIYSSKEKLVFGLVSVFVTLVSLRIALYLLKEVKE